MQTRESNHLKILVVSAVPPGDMRNGTSLRMTHFLKILGRRHHLTLVYQEGAQDFPRDPDLCFQELVAVPVGKTRLEKGVGQITKYQWPYAYFHPLRDVLLEQTRQKKFDIILSFHPAMLWYAAGIREIPVVTDLVDDLFLGQWRDMSTTPGIWQKLQQVPKVMQTLRYERKFCPQSDLCIVCAEDDAASLQRIVPRARVRVLSNGVDLAYFRLSAASMRNGHSAAFHPDLMFSGNMQFKPNVLGAEYFYHKIFPLICQQYPEVQWAIVGDSPGPSITAMSADARITVTGFVEDIRPWFENASIVISPLVSGSGIKNKILEAWAMEKAVVATPLGCSGLLARDGQNILIANSAEEFAAKVLMLMRHPEQAAALGQQGLKTVLEHYSWEKQAERLENILYEVIKHRNSQNGRFSL